MKHTHTTDSSSRVNKNRRTASRYTCVFVEFIQRKRYNVTTARTPNKFQRRHVFTLSRVYGSPPCNRGPPFSDLTFSARKTEFPHARVCVTVKIFHPLEKKLPCLIRHRCLFSRIDGNVGSITHWWIKLSTKLKRMDKSETKLSTILFSFLFFFKLTFHNVKQMERFSSRRMFLYSFDEDIVTRSNETPRIKLRATFNLIKLRNLWTGVERVEFH